MSADEARPAKARAQDGSLHNDPLPLDAEAAERLLAGSVAPDDAPPGYGRVAEMVAALKAMPSLEESAPPRYAFSAESPRPRSVLVVTHAPSRVRQRHRVRTLTAAMVSSLVLFGGLAAAGALPGPAQQATADVLHAIGVSVPAPDGSDEIPTPAVNSSGADGGSRTDTGSNSSSGGSNTGSVDNQAPTEKAKTSGANATPPGPSTPGTPTTAPTAGTVDDNPGKGPKDPKETNGKPANDDNSSNVAPGHQ